MAVETEYLTVQANTEDNPPAQESLTQVTFRPIFVYSPLDQLNLVLQVPLVNKDWSQQGGGTDGASVSHFGLGDVDVGARWFLFNTLNLGRLSRQNFALSLGSSFPSGGNNAQANGQRIDDHAQLGTGSFGPYVGALYAYYRDPWNLSLSVSGRIHSTNSFGYRYGSTLLWSLRGQLRPWERVAFTLGLDGRYAGRDTASGELQGNTGGLLLAVTPGVLVNLYDQLWFHLRAQIPAVTHLFGVQHFGPTVTGSVQYSF